MNETSAVSILMTADECGDDSTRYSYLVKCPGCSYTPNGDFVARAWPTLGTTDIDTSREQIFGLDEDNSQIKYLTMSGFAVYENVALGEHTFRWSWAISAEVVT